MKRTSRVVRTVALLLATGMAVAATPALAGTPAADGSAPRVLSVRLDPPAVIGRFAELQVLGLAGNAPVSGMVVRFGRASGVGLSACLASSDGQQEAPGSRVRLAAPHVFERPGTRTVLVRLDSGGCAATGKSTYQPVAVTPARPGEPPGAPTLLPAPPPGLDVPPLTGVDDLPLPALPLPPMGARKGALPPCQAAGRRVARSAQGMREARRALLCLLNAHRRAHGLTPLGANRRLRRAATAHSGTMVRRGFFSHVQPGGVGVASRLRQSRYITPNRAWAIGETIGFGRGPASKPSWVVRAWMGSTPHRAVILNGRYREVGLGIAGGVPGRPRVRGATFTADFGVRR